MSRKNKRLRAMSEGQNPEKARKGMYLSEELNDVQTALIERDLWPDYPGSTMGVPPVSSAPVRRKPQINMDLVRSLLKMQGVVLGPPPDDLTTLPNDITWVVAGNGVFQIRKTQFGIVCAKIEKLSIDTLPDWKPPAYAWPLPKMPWSVFAPAIAFLRWVKETYDTEGLIRAYWDEQTAHLDHAGWTIHVPDQRVTAVSVDVANNVEDPGLGIFALELHSHPGNSSTFSGTDDDNEQRQRMFGCVAGLTNKPSPPNFHWRIGTGAEVWAEVDLDDLVSVSDTITFNLTALACIKNNLVFDPFQTAAFPDEWKARVTAPAKGPVRYQSWPKETIEASETDEDIFKRQRETEARWYREHNLTPPTGNGQVTSRSWKP